MPEIMSIEIKDVSKGGDYLPEHEITVKIRTALKESTIIVKKDILKLAKEQGWYVKK